MPKMPIQISGGPIVEGALYTKESVTVEGMVGTGYAQILAHICQRS